MKPLIIAASFLLCAGAQAETIYKWTDDQGGVHYSNERPPAHVKATVVDTTEPVRSSPSAQRSAPKPETPAEEPDLQSAPEPQSKRPSLKQLESGFQKRRSERLAEQARQEEQAGFDARRMQRACDRARMSLAQAIASPPRLAQKAQARTDVWVYYPEERDEPPPSMNNAERSEKITQLETYIAKHCGKTTRN